MFLETSYVFFQVLLELFPNASIWSALFVNYNFAPSTELNPAFQSNFFSFFKIIFLVFVSAEFMSA